MGRMVRALATLAVVSGAATLVVSSLAGASGPPNAPLTAGTPLLWELHVQKYPGGISNGVRAALAAANANVSAPTTKVQPLAVRPSTVRSGNVQMNNSSYPPLPENETAVALNAFNENIAVAASNDYVSGGLLIMRTADGGHSWKSTRVVPVYRHAGDPLSGNTCQGGDPSVAYSARDRVFFASQLCFFRGLSVGGPDLRLPRRRQDLDPGPASSHRRYQFQQHLAG